MRFILFQPHLWLNLSLVTRHLSLILPPMSALNADLQKAVQLVLAGDWDAAHQIVQQYEDNEIAAWIHAVLHKVEGDNSNARYWYRHANRLDHVNDEPRAELEAIQAELTTDEHGFDAKNYEPPGQTGLRSPNTLSTRIRALSFDLHKWQK